MNIKLMNWTLCCTSSRFVRRAYKLGKIDGDQPMILHEYKHLTNCRPETVIVLIPTVEKWEHVRAEGQMTHAARRDHQECNECDDSATLQSDFTAPSLVLLDTSNFVQSVWLDHHKVHCQPSFWSNNYC